MVLARTTEIRATCLYQLTSNHKINKFIHLVNFNLLIVPAQYSRLMKDVSSLEGTTLKKLYCMVWVEKFLTLNFSKTTCIKYGVPQAFDQKCTHFQFSCPLCHFIFVGNKTWQIKSRNCYNWLREKNKKEKKSFSDKFPA